MILARVRRTLDDRALAPRGAAVLVACSGGPDSAALLHVLHRLAPERDLRLHVASVNHGLREDADRDVEAARALAEDLAVPVRALSVLVAMCGSLQAAARDARYAALHAEAERLGASLVAVGHTMDDQAETVLSRLLRGAGVIGLAGIAPAREDGVIRPLIDCRREDVRAHVARFSLPHVEDPSNADPRFERVRLRALLPQLRDEDPRVVEHLAQLADEARELSALVSDAEPGNAPSTAALSAMTPMGRRAVLGRWVTRVVGGPAKRAHLDALERVCAGGPGEVLLPRGWVARREGDRLVARSEPDRVTRSRPVSSERSA